MEFLMRYAESNVMRKLSRFFQCFYSKLMGKQGEGIIWKIL